MNDGHVSDFIIVAANTDSNKNNNSLSLVIVKSNQDGVKSESLETIDPSRPSSKIVLDNADAELLGNSGEGWEMIQKIFDRAAVLRWKCKASIVIFNNIFNLICKFLFNFQPLTPNFSFCKTIN